MNAYNDYELIDLIHGGSEEAINILYDKYRPIILKKCKDAYNKLGISAIDINDLIQESYISFDEAIDKFSQRDDVTFYTFSLLCIDRRLINIIRKYNSHKEKALFEAIDIDDVNEKYLIKNNELENAIYSKEITNKLIKKIKAKLTKKEKDVFNLKILGYTNEEIADKTGDDIKSIYNSIQRIKSKIKNILKS